MDKEMSLKNRDRLIQLGITISTFRKYRGLSQEQLAERASVSRSLISSIEAAGIAKSFSLEVFYNIADALEIEPATLLSAPTQFDNLLKPDLILGIADIESLQHRLPVSYTGGLCFFSFGKCICCWSEKGEGYHGRLI